MKVITFFNNKGGVGKTTLAVNIAAYFKTEMEFKLLFLDLDPQANSTQLLLTEDKWMEIYGVGVLKTRKSIIDYFEDIINGDSNLNNCDVPVKRSDSSYQIDLVPGHPKLSLIEDVFSDAWKNCTSGDIGGARKTNWLNTLKNEYKSKYDFIFIDIGPSLGALNRTVLLNSDFFITPMGSDIFSILGIENISSWMKTWIELYKTGISNLKTKLKNDFDSTVRKYQININPDSTTRFLGYSVQQYVTKKFKEGKRPVKAYDEIISKIPSEIKTHLVNFIKDGLNDDNLLLGDIPFLYSIVPLSQASKVPMFNLKHENGLRGNQKANVDQYRKMICTISNKIIANIGEKNG